MADLACAPVVGQEVPSSSLVARFVVPDRARARSHHIVETAPSSTSGHHDAAAAPPSSAAPKPLAGLLAPPDDGSQEPDATTDEYYYYPEGSRDHIHRRAGLSASIPLKV
ncbi:uncharacterized protein [Triticum aestivum]|uniref:uncharacterized protein n=1 Tax=Triticum aestivum TaxID=4565 RepID=UPI001D0063B6|nr:uncharacterized protein LOC123171112 [Triticum aestivum]